MKRRGGYKEGMRILDNYRIKKSINTLLSSQNSASPETSRAVAKLKQIGRPALPKLIEALGTARNRERIVGLLVTFVQDATLPVFVEALAKSPSSRVVAGVVDVLSKCDTYNPNPLLSLLANPKVASEHLEKILARHKHRLRPEALFRLLTAVGNDQRAAIFRIVDHVATEATIPELIHRLRTDDWSVRLNIARTLSRFRTSGVRDTLVRLLSDPHKDVRLVALEGLAAMRLPFDMGSLCLLLRDADVTVKHKAMDVFFTSLQDASEDVRKRAVEGLNAVGDAGLIKECLGRLKNQDWQVTVGVANTLGTYSNTKTIEAMLTLLKDQDAFIRRCVFESLHTMKDERIFTTLVEALKDKEVREYIVDALAALGDSRAVPMFLGMLEGDAETSLIAIRALVALGEPQAIHPLLVQLHRPDKPIRHEAMHALTVLTNEKYAPDVLQAMMAVREGADEETKELANRMATTIIKRFGQKVMPRSVYADAAAQTSQECMDDATADVALAPAVFDTPTHGLSEQGVVAGERVSKPIIDVTMLEPGVVLADRYRVIRRVGQGGFSTVFLADDTVVHEDVILKILNPQVALDDGMNKRFLHELRYARKVTHENVIRIYDFITLGKSYAISMEYFLSHNLAAELQEGEPLSLKRGLKIIWDVCRGIGAAHQVNVVHRDLKPPNILINDIGVVKIVDFGVAAVSSDIGTRLTRVGTLLGTPTYMAPEQVRSLTIDARTDIYSLGVIMYEMFTGRPPYVGEDMAVLFQHVEGNPVPPGQINQDLAPALETIILKAMAVDPEQRFQSVEALRKSLVNFSRQIR
jgi:HEAT repeat protein/tRNA A-37 threonylcarbamoyl transferase component Bud32